MFSSFHARRVPAAILLLLFVVPLARAEGPGRRYVGILHVTHTCPTPQFQESATMDVEVLPDGDVIIADATMHYGGTEQLEGCTYTRTGDWQISPLGWYQAGPPAHVEVDENIQFSEHILMECDPPLGTVIDEWPEGTYDGHLAFPWDEASIDGAVVVGTGDPQNDVVWRLTLIPALPIDHPTWSTVKALYGR